MRETPVTTSTTAPGRTGTKPTLGAAVSVDRPYQDDFGCGMRAIGHDAEHIENRHGVPVRSKARRHSTQPVA